MKKFLIYAGAFTFTGIAAYIVENQEKIDSKLNKKYKFNQRKEKLNSYASRAQNALNVLNRYDLNNLKAADYLNIVTALFITQTAIQTDEQDDNKDNLNDNSFNSEENSNLSSVNTFKNEDKQDDRNFHVADGVTSDHHDRHDSSYHDNNYYDDSSSSYSSGSSSYDSGSSSFDSGSSSSFDSGSSFDGGSSF